jgi:drug/metabolite transporter (DMT)-like permease
VGGAPESVDLAIGRAVPGTAAGVGCCVTGMTILGASVAVSREIVDLPACYALAARYAVAAAILIAFAARVPRPSAPSAPATGRRSPAAERIRIGGRLTLLATSGLVVFNVVVLGALRRTDPAVLGSVIGCTPLVLACAGPIQRGHRPSSTVLKAAAIVVLGAAIVQGTGRASASGLALAMIALVCEAAFSLLAAPLLFTLGAVRVSAASCAIAVPMLLLLGWAAGERWQTPTVPQAAALGYLAVFLTAGAFVLWYTGVTVLGVERAGLFAGVVPVASLVAAAVLDRDLPGAGPVIGVGLVGAGIAAGLRGSRRQVASPAGSGLRGAAAARQEAGDVDDDANDLAHGDEAALVGRRDHEREPSAVDLREHRFGDHLGPDRRRLQVVEPDVDAHGRGALVELGCDGAAAGLFAQRDQPRRAEDVDRP